MTESEGVEMEQCEHVQPFVPSGALLTLFLPTLCNQYFYASFSTEGNRGSVVVQLEITRTEP